MKLAFCLFNYFPYGGLQRDFLQIANTCELRGHEIHVYTMACEGELPASFQVHLLEKRGRQNHTRIKHFIDQLSARLSEVNYDLVIGFNKMPYLDIYYAADVCYQARIQSIKKMFYQFLPRYQALVRWEKMVFAAGRKTQILFLSDQQKKDYTAFYQTEAARFHLLPPGIDKNRLIGRGDRARRFEIRAMHGITAETIILLMVGSGFKTKGLDRAIKGFAALPDTLKKRCHFYVIGKDRPHRFMRLAASFSLEQQVTFLGGRDDVPDFLVAADLLLHPAYHENTGTVILEAILSGLPVLTVEVCGYAHYVKEAKAGVVLASPFDQIIFNITLKEMLLSPHYATWRENGLAFSKGADVYSMKDKAVNFIEQLGS